MENIEYLELLVYGSYIFTLVAVYFLVAVIYHINRSSQVKLLGLTLDQKNAAKNRQKVKESLETIVRERQMAFLWPVFLIKRASAYVKEKFKKEEQ